MTLDLSQLESYEVLTLTEVCPKLHSEAITQYEHLSELQWLDPAMCGLS